MKAPEKIKSFTGIHSFQDLYLKSELTGLNRSQKISFTIGRIFVAVGTIIGLVPLTIFFSFPLYTIGNTMILTNKKLPSRTKTKWLAFPIVIVLVTWAIIISTSGIYEWLMR